MAQIITMQVKPARKLVSHNPPKPARRKSAPPAAPGVSLVLMVAALGAWSVAGVRLFRALRGQL